MKFLYAAVVLFSFLTWRLLRIRKILRKQKQDEYIRSTVGEGRDWGEEHRMWFDDQLDRRWKELGKDGE